MNVATIAVERKPPLIAASAFRLSQLAARAAHTNSVIALTRAAVAKKEFEKEMEEDKKTWGQRTAVDVGGLTHGSLYCFRVRLGNRAGVSEWSRLCERK